MVLRDFKITNTQSAVTDIHKTLSKLAVKHCYKDVKLICCDDTIWSVRVILALVYPHMADILKDRNQEKELVLILPDITAEEVITKVEQFLQGKIKDEVIEDSEVLEVTEDEGVESKYLIREQEYEEQTETEVIDEVATLDEEDQLPQTVVKKVKTVRDSKAVKASSVHVPSSTKTKTPIPSDEDIFLSMTEQETKRTRKRYWKIWTDFKEWCELSDELETRPPTEEEMLNYFTFLREEKGFASNSLFTMYSMLNFVTKSKYCLSLKRFPSIIELIKEVVVKKEKVKTFTMEEFDKFVRSEDISDPYWLVRKVVVIVAYFGGLRFIDTDSLLIEDFTTTQDGVKVCPTRVKNRPIKQFLIPRESDSGLKYAKYVEDYLELVKEGLGETSGRVWFTGRHDALAGNSMGKNSINKIPQDVAGYLKLEESTTYTFHSLRIEQSE